MTATGIVVAQVAVAACFVAAGVAKLWSGGADSRSARSLGVPAWFARRLRWPLPAAELMIGGLLVWPATARLGAALAGGLLAVFTALTAGVWLRRRPAVCGCFGAATERPVDGWTVGRNVLLVGLTALLLVSGPPVLSGAGRALVAAAAVIAAQSWLLSDAWRQRSGPRPPAGEESRTLITVDGGRSELRGRPAVLVFLDPGCGPCRRMVPLVAAWQRRPGDGPAMLVVARDGPDRRTAFADLTQTVVLDVGEWDEWETTYGLRGTPSAVSVDASGTPTGAPVEGADAIAALVQGPDRMSTPVAISPARPAAGEEPAEVVRPDGARPDALSVTIGVDTGTEMPVPAADPAGRWTVVIGTSTGCADCDAVIAAARQRPELDVHRMLVVDDDAARRQFGLTGAPAVLILDAAGRPLAAPAVGAAASLATVAGLAALAAEPAAVG